MIQEIEQVLEQLLQLQPGTEKTLKSRENTQLEYKETFHLRSLPKYVRTMIGFANARGGFIVFGVKDSPRQLCGVNLEFEKFDAEKITSLLRDHVSPEMEWAEGTFHLQGMNLGYIYTYEATEKPVMSTRALGKDLKEKSIFYRYRAQTTLIEYSELRNIIDDRIEKERIAWMQHLQSIIRAGPTNVGVLDTVEGKLHGPGATFLIEEPLIRKLKFIQQGRFSETTGDPTLRLVGDVSSVDGTLVRFPVKEGIHLYDLIADFLSKKHLEPYEALNYVKEAAHQNSFNLPIYYFISLAGITIQEAVSVINQESGSSFSRTRDGLMSRLNNDRQIMRIGTAPPEMTTQLPDAPRDLSNVISHASTPGEKRGILLTALSTNPVMVQQTLSSLPVVQLCEALTHIPKDILKRFVTDIFRVALGLLQEKYDNMGQRERDVFRRTVAYLDQQLYYQAAEE